MFWTGNLLTRFCLSVADAAVENTDYIIEENKKDLASDG